MRILILGGNGMIGHQLFEYLQSKHNVRVTLRGEENTYKKIGLFNKDNSYFNIDIRNLDCLQKVFNEFKPEVVINAIGIVKQKKSAEEADLFMKINGLFPHALADICQTFQARLIHLSTDCVFSGKKGNYTEKDIPDAKDLYGESKARGEVLDKSHCITVRKSAIGLELGKIVGRVGLIEWFLLQKDDISGYRRAIYTGLTTIELGRVVECVIMQHQNLSGLWHIASAQQIDKYELLSMLAKKLGRQDVTIHADDEFVCDRSLNAKAFEKETGYHSPSWDAMLDELALVIKKEVK